MIWYQVVLVVLCVDGVVFFGGIIMVVMYCIGKGLGQYGGLIVEYQCMYWYVCICCFVGFGKGLGVGYILGNVFVLVELFDEVCIGFVELMVDFVYWIMMIFQVIQIEVKCCCQCGVVLMLFIENDFQDVWYVQLMEDVGVDVFFYD